jgi:hypothetical protein
VGVVRAGRYTDLGGISECFDGSRAANRAVTRVLSQGLFRIKRRARFQCEIDFPSPEALREWIAGYADVSGLASHERLVQKAERAIRRSRAAARITARIPFLMRVLLKQAR